MKIMTFNTQHCLNYLENRIDFPFFARTIKESGADVIGLNEMRGKGERTDYEDQVKILSELSGIENYYFARAIYYKGMNPYGNGLLTKHKILNAETLPIPDPEGSMEGKHYESRCILKATLDCGLTVLVTHFGLNPDEQENAVKTILEHVTPERCILMGDFNVTPEASVLAPIREKMNDASDALSTSGLTFPSDAPDRKIDYIFATPDIEIISAEVPPLVVSDHRPHTAEIKF